MVTMIKTVEYCNKAIELEPNNADAWYYKGWALGNLARFDEEIECLDKVLELDPKYESAWFLKGVALYSFSRFHVKKGNYYTADYHMF